jgi:hypothetical protein
MAQYRQFWEGSLDRLDAYLQQLQAVEKAQDSAAQALAAKPAEIVNPAIAILDSPAFTSAAKKTPGQKRAASRPTPERKAP